MRWLDGDAMGALNQIFAVTAMNLRALPGRIGPSLVIVIGMGAVVAVVISVLSMSSGFLDSVNKTGRPDRAIVTSAGAVSESASSLPRDSISTIVDARDIRKTEDGKPVVSADIFTYFSATKKSDGLLEPATVHGVGPQAFALLPQIHLVSGRMFRPAVHELIVGRMMQSQFEGFDVGSQLSLPEGDWTIVGSFESDGDQHESELLGDTETVMSAYRRTAFNSVTVMLNSPDAFAAFKDSLTTNPALNVDVVRETDYFAKLSKPLNDFLTLVAYAVGGIMGLGAVVGALNTMYSAVSTRSLEIATLRAIGFGAGPVVISVLAEALLLTFLGAVLGAGAAWLFFNGNVVVSDYYIYSMVVRPALLVLGVAWAVAIGMIGGLFPAIRAARLPIATALRAT
jgi:putative ABC transport system permease protein